MRPSQLPYGKSAFAELLILTVARTTGPDRASPLAKVSAYRSPRNAPRIFPFLCNDMQRLDTHGHD